MLVLTIDTATPAVTAGLVRLDRDRPPELLAGRAQIGARAHGELLTPSVRAVLAAAGSVFDQLDAVVCGAGPGPFTGLRVGLVTAATFGDALHIPVHPVCSLDAIAHDAGTGRPLLVVTDARRREVYWARYDETGHRVAGPDVDPPAQVPIDGLAAAAGTAAHAVGLPAFGPEHPTPTGLVRTAAAELHAGSPAAPVTPIYLRRPDAATPGPRKRVTA